MAFRGRGAGGWARGPGADVRTSDVVLGAAAAVVILGSTALAVATVKISPAQEAASVLRTGEIAVAVQPAPAAEGEFSGVFGIGQVKQPRERQPSPRASVESMPVPPRPKGAPTGSPGAALPERPEGGIRSLPRIDRPTETLPTLGDDPGFGVGGPAVAPGEGDPATSPNDPYAYVDPAKEVADAPGPGAVSDEQPGAGDPLASRAVAAYRQRLQRWLARYFLVENSGLPVQVLRKAVIHATLHLAEDRIVVDYDIAPGGLAPVEAAARRALDRVVGQPVPELPAHYPGPLQRSIRVTFTCTEDTCS